MELVLSWRSKAVKVIEKAAGYFMPQECQRDLAVYMTICAGMTGQGLQEGWCVS